MIQEAWNTNNNEDQIEFLIASNRKNGGKKGK